MLSVKAGDGPVRTAQARFTGFVRASLTGPEEYVSITSDGAREKAIEAGSNPRWSWTVVPKEDRDVTLLLSFFNQYERPNGTFVELDGPTYETTIRVRPTDGSWFDAIWRGGALLWEFALGLSALMGTYFGWQALMPRRDDRANDTDQTGIAPKKQLLRGPSVFFAITSNYVDYALVTVITSLLPDTCKSVTFSA